MVWIMLWILLIKCVEKRYRDMRYGQKSVIWQMLGNYLAKVWQKA